MAIPTGLCWTRGKAVGTDPLKIFNIIYRFLFPAVVVAVGCIVVGAYDDANTYMDQALRDCLVKYCDSRYRNEIINKYKSTTVLVSSKFSYDYGIEYHNNTLTLKAKDKKTAEWLIDQYVRHLAYTDTHFTNCDLPPTIIDFGKTVHKNFDFIYREPHFSPNLKERYQPFSGASSVEEYWDLWGHNLYKELDIDTEKQQVICFTNDIFYNKVVKFLEEKSRSLRTGRIIIMPMDTMSACTCTECQKIGNKNQYATPAVMNMMDKLKERFSKTKYTFYTAAYHSTQQPPQKPPKYRLSGLLLSTSDLPKGIALDPQNDLEKDFIKTVQAWNNYADTLYVWDYAANYNDFLTPLPILYVLKKNLKFFRDNGISGVFLQGSGYDYSPFDDIKTFVATALMIDGQLDVDDLCSRYFTQFYPVSAKMMTDYYLSLEKTMEQREKKYDLHGDMKDAIDSYFCADDFFRFYENLGIILSENKMESNEKNRLEKLYSALSFTWLQLELYRQTGSYDITKINGKTLSITPDIQTVISRLSAYEHHGFRKYKEKGEREIKDYLDFWSLFAEK